MVLLLSHLIACAWFLIGRVCLENSVRNWIAVAGVEDASWSYKYLTSLHWSLTQFTPASVDISARNVPERIYSIIVLFFAMVIFSSIVGSISASMTAMRSISENHQKKFWYLRRYLKQRSIDKPLRGRIVKFLEHRELAESKLVPAKQVTVLERLSDALRDELTHQMNSVFLLEHPFFLFLNEETTFFVQRICQDALSRQYYAEAETVFSAGDEARKMYFVVGDCMEYKMRGALAFMLEQREWVGEGILWTAWRHLGRLQASAPNELIILTPEKVPEVLRLHPRPWFFAKAYARKFIGRLNQIDPCDLSDVLRENLYPREEHLSMAFSCRDAAREQKAAE
jgi:hypothetical protein